MSSEDNVASLMAMGFARADVERALAAASGVEQAVELLMSGGAAPAPAPAPAAAAGGGDRSEGVAALGAMGFAADVATQALIRYDNNVERALNWLLEGGSAADAPPAAPAAPAAPEPEPAAPLPDSQMDEAPDEDEDPPLEDEEFDDAPPPFEDEDEEPPSDEDGEEEDGEAKGAEGAADPPELPITGLRGLQDGIADIARAQEAAGRAPFGELSVGGDAVVACTVRAGEEYGGGAVELTFSVVDVAQYPRSRVRVARVDAGAADEDDFCNALLCELLEGSQPGLRQALRRVCEAISVAVPAEVSKALALMDGRAPQLMRAASVESDYGMAEDDDDVTAFALERAGNRELTEEERLDPNNSNSFLQRLVDDPNYDPSMDVQLEGAFYLPPVDEQLAVNLLDDTQRAAMAYVVERAKAASDAAMPQLEQKLASMGHGPEVLSRVLMYIRDEAQIIVHFPDDVLSKLVNTGPKDQGGRNMCDYMRNQFETKTSRGALSESSRTTWERNLFGGLYDSANGWQRCKYGCLNITQDPEGVQPARQYGDSFFVMQKVRLRTTFADMDTSGTSTPLSSCEYYAHCLNTYTDQELQAVVDVATGVAPYRESSVISNYKEIQLHGPVAFNRDVLALYMNPKHRGDATMDRILQQFLARNPQIILIWQDEAKGARPAGGS